MPEWNKHLERELVAEYERPLADVREASNDLLLWSNSYAYVGVTEQQRPYIQLVKQMDDYAELRIIGLWAEAFSEENRQTMGYMTVQNRGDSKLYYSLSILRWHMPAVIAMNTAIWELKTRENTVIEMFSQFALSYRGDSIREKVNAAPTRVQKRGRSPLLKQKYDDRTIEIRRLKNMGWSNESIADNLEISLSTVKRTLRKEK